jgi:hypothetical protein
MASYGVFLALCGFEYNGPKGHLGFAPRLSPANFRASFTAAEGWGTFEQRIQSKVQTAFLQVKWGQLRARTLSLEVPKNERLASAVVTVGRSKLESTVRQEGRRVFVELTRDTVLKVGDSLRVQIKLA